MKTMLKIGKFILLAIFLLMAIAPLYWVIVTSLKADSEIYSYPIKYWPERFNLENYKYLFQISNFGIYFRNSIGVSLIAAFGALLTSTFSGYALSRFKKKRTKVLFLLAMYFTQIIPTYMIMAPLFTIFAGVQQTDSLFALTLVYISIMIAFSTIMGKSFFDRIPVSLEEAAMIDGCTKTQTLLKVVIPLTLPGLAAIFSFAFVRDDILAEHGINYAFTEVLVSSKVAEVLAKEAGVKTAVLNPLANITKRDIEDGKNYFSIMYTNLEVLKMALK